MKKELKGLIIEVIVLTIILLITVPICAKASSNYNKQKETSMSAINTTIDVTSKTGNIKELNIYSNTTKPIEIKLGLMISHFYDDYYINIDGRTYSLNQLEYTKDEEYNYYIIGTYKIEELKKVEFELKPQKQNYYKENLTYSFYAKGTI